MYGYARDISDHDDDLYQRICVLNTMFYKNESAVSVTLGTLRSGGGADLGLGGRRPGRPPRRGMGYPAAVAAWDTYLPPQQGCHRPPEHTPIPPPR